MPVLSPACLMPPPPATTRCADPKVSCWYDDGTRCFCSDCRNNTGIPICQPLDPPEWFCSTPKAGCPKGVPQAGQPCATPGQDCGVGDLGIVCKGGVWTWLAPSAGCAAPDTMLATPEGDRPIASLAVGDLVYSVDHDAVVAVPLVRVQRTPVVGHHVMRVVLTSGAVLQISARHPTADGRWFKELTAGSALDQTHTVASAELVPYGYDATYDVLPASSTGTYFAAGALIGSTLFTPGLETPREWITSAAWPSPP